MATFVLADELDLLEWDFSPKSSPGAGPKGIIPEPTSGQLQAFTRAIRHITAPVASKIAKAEGASAAVDITKLNPAEIGKLIEEADATEGEAASTLRDIVDAIAAVCSDSPNAAQINGLPHRAQQAFFGYIIGTFLDPKSQTPGLTL